MFRVKAGEEADPLPEKKGFQAVADPAHTLHPQVQAGEKEVKRRFSPPEVQDQGGQDGGKEEAQGPCLGFQEGAHFLAHPARKGSQEGKEGGGQEVKEKKVAKKRL